MKRQWSNRAIAAGKLNDRRGRNIDSLPTLCYPKWTRPPTGHFVDNNLVTRQFPMTICRSIDHALLRVIRIVEWSGRLCAALRRAATLDPACRLGKIETPPSPTPRTGTQDSRSECLPQPLYNFIRLVAVFCLSQAAQGAGRRNAAGSLLIHHVAVEKLAPFSDRAYRTGAARRLDRRQLPPRKSLSS